MMSTGVAHFPRRMFFIKNGNIDLQVQKDYQDGGYRCVGRILVSSDGTCWRLGNAGCKPSNGCGESKYLILKMENQN
jgi:hypothetical protein